MSFTIAEFNKDFSKSIAEGFDNQSMEAIMKSSFTMWADVQDTTEYNESFNSTEWSSGTKFLAEGEVLPQLDLGKGYKVSFDSQEFGNSIVYSYKSRIKAKDNTETILANINSLKNTQIIGMANFVETQVHAILNTGFGTTDFLSPDGKALFATDHEWNSTGNTFDNLLNPAALDVSVVDEVRKRGWAFLDSDGKPMPQDYNTVIVKKGGTAAQAAKRLFFGENASQFQVPTISGINLYFGEFKLIETPYLQSDTAYYFMSDAQMSWVENPLFVNFVERPTLQNGGEAHEDNSLNWRRNFAGSFKHGIRNLPFNILGSQGA